MLDARIGCRAGSLVSWNLLLLSVVMLASQAFAVSSVVVESKSFAPGQTACTVGVFVRNDEPIQAIVLPLELRSTLGPGYLSVPTPGSFRFRLVGENRVGKSPLGLAGDNWPAPFVTSMYFANPYFGSDPWVRMCSGPISHSYFLASASADGVSPDAIFYVTNSIGDPTIGEEWILPPGEDPSGTGNASFQFVFNVTEETGCMRIDTCCKTPANRLGMVSAYDELVSIEFTRGIIRIGDVECPGYADPNANQAPVAQCVDSLVVYVGQECRSYVTDPSLIDAGSYDAEDGTNIYMGLSRTGPFKPGTHKVALVVCDRDSKCTSCSTSVVVRDSVPPSVQFECDTLRLLYDGASGGDDVCTEVPIDVRGCGLSPHVVSSSGSYLKDDYVLVTDEGRAVRVCINGVLAGNGPNGTYFGEVILGRYGSKERDTLAVVITVDHPPVPPGCDSVCGFVYSVDGSPIEHARVEAITCAFGNMTKCSRIPDVLAFTDSAGRFCVQTFGWPYLVLTVRALGFSSTYSAVDGCGDLPTYFYLLEGDEWIPACCFSAPPACATHGFVVGSVDGDSAEPVAGATVELWNSYPDGSMLTTTHTDGFGHFGLRQFSGVLTVRKLGYCPTILQNVNCGFDAVHVTLEPVTYTAPVDWPDYITRYHSDNATFAGVPIRPGDAIYATDPQNVICGAVWAHGIGSFSILVIGDDPSTITDEGAMPGDEITLWLNCDYVVAAPHPWENSAYQQFDPEWTAQSAASIDILPGICPNAVDTGIVDLVAPGVRPGPAGVAPEKPTVSVAILGSGSLDATRVDPSTVNFQGLSVLSHQLVDVSRPPRSDVESDCVCPEQFGPDGLPDLVLNYDQKELLASLPEGQYAGGHNLLLTATTKRGRTLSGADCLTVKSGPTRVVPGRAPGSHTKSNLATYPNPFNAEAVVSFTLAAETQVRVEVFNVLGRKVASIVEGALPAGDHRFDWNAADMASGIYFVRLMMPDGVTTKKVALVR